MARALSITSPPDKTDIVLHALQLVPEVIELQVFRTASVNLPGDVIKLIECAPDKQGYYVINQSLTDYWTTISAVSVLTFLLASIAVGLIAG